MPVPAADLIERLGPPPSIVCEDWMLQIESMVATLREQDGPRRDDGSHGLLDSTASAEASSSRRHRVGPAVARPSDQSSEERTNSAGADAGGEVSLTEPDRLSKHLHWTDFEVLEDGRLRLLVRPTAAESFDSILQQLQKWLQSGPAGGSGMPAAFGSAADEQHSAPETTSQRHADAADHDRSTPTGGNMRRRAEQSFPRASRAAAGRIAASDSAIEAQHRNGSPWRLSTGALGVLGGGGALALLLAFAFWPGETSAPHRIAQERSAVLTEPEQMRPAPPLNGLEQGSEPSIPASLSEQATATGAEELLTLDLDDLHASSSTPAPSDLLGSVLPPSETSEPPPDSAAAPDAPSSSPSPKGGNATDSESLSAPVTIVLDAPRATDAPNQPDSPASPEGEIDSVAEVEKMAEQFRSEGVEVALPDQHDAWQNVVLDLGTTVHRYKSPVMATLQTRQTTWELQMMVPEGLIVTPPEPIQVDRKRPGGWTIRPADDQDTSAVVVVQVRALGTRGDKLQFQIFATAPQMSVLRLPMAAPFLEAARSRLHFLQQQLYVADRHWDQLAKSGGGVSREVVRQAQKQVDQQARQVAALLDFVADAARLEALLDGQTEVKLRRIEAGSTAPVGEQ